MMMMTKCYLATGYIENNLPGNAGINLTGYHPPPGTPGLLQQNVCPAPGLLHNRKCPGAGPIKDDVPGAGHLYQLAFKHEHC